MKKMCGRMIFGKNDDQQQESSTSEEQVPNYVREIITVEYCSLNIVLTL